MHMCICMDACINTQFLSVYTHIFVILWKSNSNNFLIIQPFSTYGIVHVYTQLIFVLVYLMLSVTLFSFSMSVLNVFCWHVCQTLFFNFTGFHQILFLNQHKDTEDRNLFFSLHSSSIIGTSKLFAVKWREKIFRWTWVFCKSDWYPFHVV